MRAFALAISFFSSSVNMMACCASISSSASLSSSRLSIRRLCLCAVVAPSLAFGLLCKRRCVKSSSTRVFVLFAAAAAAVAADDDTDVMLLRFDVLFVDVTSGELTDVADGVSFCARLK